MQNVVAFHESKNISYVMKLANILHKKDQCECYFNLSNLLLLSVTLLMIRSALRKTQ